MKLFYLRFVFHAISVNFHSMKKFSFIKTVACFFLGTVALAGCQKEDTPNANKETGEVDYAVDVTGIDARDFGKKTDWLSATGSLSYLNGSNLPEMKPQLFYALDGEEYNKNIIVVPKGIYVKAESYIYVTFVGESANFNNVLGYYYYEAGNTPDKAGILEQIFKSGPEGTFFKNIIYSNTKNLQFGQTFKLADDDGNPFKAGTVVGFCIMPNSGGGNVVYDNGDYTTTLPQVKTDSDGNPYLIVTDWMVNKEKTVSHVVGQSACGDLVISFEDLNSNYSNTDSDQDFNDLVFVVGDNLVVRETTKLEAYAAGTTFDLDDLGEFCLR